jgi:hypothetical protein
MRRLALAVAALTLIAACGEDVPGTQPGVTPSPRPSSPISADNLSGTWVFGESGEPPAGPVYACTAGQLLTINDQRGALSGGVSICGGPCALRETFTGKNTKGVATFEGEFQGNIAPVAEVVTYRLTFDPQTQHLVGTRSGRPFWAAPLVAPSKAECADVVQ